MATLATPSDLASYLQTATVDTFSATLALDAAEAQVRTVVRRELTQMTRVESTVVIVDSHARSYVKLKCPPIVSISSVVLDDGTSATYRVEADRPNIVLIAFLQRAPILGWPWTMARRPYATVTYIGGYLTGDPGLGEAKAITLRLAASLFRNPVGAASEAVETFRVDWSATPAELTLSERRRLQRAYGPPAISSLPGVRY